MGDMMAIYVFIACIVILIVGFASGYRAGKIDASKLKQAGVEPSKPWSRTDEPVRYEVHLSSKRSECYVKRNGEKLERVSSVEILHDMNGNNLIPRVSVDFVLRKNDTLDITTDGEIQEGKSRPLTNPTIY